MSNGPLIKVEGYTCDITLKETTIYDNKSYGPLLENTCNQVSNMKLLNIFLPEIIIIKQ